MRLTPGARRPVPPPWSSALPRRLALVAIALAGLGVASAAAVSSGDGKGPTELARPTTVPPSTADDLSAVDEVSAPPAEAAAAATVADESSPSEPAADAGSEPGPAEAPTPTRTPIEPGPVALPAPGRYQERVVRGDGSSSDATLVVTAAGRGRRRLTEGGDTDRLLEVGEADGIDELSAGRGSAGCDWSPAATLVPPDLIEGASWSVEASCTTRDGTADVTRQEDAIVRGRARTTLEGDSIDCWLIERHTVTTSWLEGATIVVESVSTELFAPSLGLAVYRTSRTDVPRSDGTVVSVLLATELLTTP